MKATPSNTLLHFVNKDKGVHNTCRIAEKNITNWFEFSSSAKKKGLANAVFTLREVPNFLLNILPSSTYLIATTEYAYIYYQDTISYEYATVINYVIKI